MLHLAVLMYMVGNGLMYSRNIAKNPATKQEKVLQFNENLWYHIGREWWDTGIFPSVYR